MLLQQPLPQWHGQHHDCNTWSHSKPSTKPTELLFHSERPRVFRFRVYSLQFRVHFPLQRSRLTNLVNSCLPKSMGISFSDPLESHKTFAWQFDICSRFCNLLCNSRQSWRWEICLDPMQRDNQGWTQRQMQMVCNSNCQQETDNKSVVKALTWMLARHTSKPPARIWKSTPGGGSQEANPASNRAKHQ